MLILNISINIAYYILDIKYMLYTLCGSHPARVGDPARDSILACRGEGYAAPRETARMRTGA